MMGRGLRIGVVVSALSLLGACGGGGADKRAAASDPDVTTVWINACDVISQAESEAAVGRPLPFSRLGLGAPEYHNLYGNQCVREAPREAQTSIWVDGSLAKPAEDAKWFKSLVDKGYQKDGSIPGTAYVGAEGPHAVNVEVTTPKRLSISVEVAHRTATADALRRAAVELATKLATRVDEQYPGKRDHVPDSARHGATNPCTLAPAGQRVKITGWVSDREIGSADGPITNRYTGGLGGGADSCVYIRPDREATLSIDITDGTVTPTDLAARAQPLRELKRAAVYDPPGEDLVPGDGGSELTVQLDDGRAVIVYLRDAKADAAAHKRMQVALAQLILANVKSG